MYSYAIGSIIAEERKKEDVSLRSLASGICTHQMLSKIEEDQCDTDKLLMDILLQRLGKSPDRLECILSEEEFRQIRTRDYIEELILKGKTKKAMYLLEKYYEAVKSGGAVYEMYYYRTKAYINLRCNQDTDEACRNIVLAIETTFPEWTRRTWDTYLLSTYEIENLLFYGKILYLQGKEAEAVSLLEKCFHYIEQHFTDEEEKAKVFSKCVWLLTQVDKDESHNKELLIRCEKAMDMLRKCAITYFMLPLIREMVSRYQQSWFVHKAEYWQRYQEMLECLYQEYAPDMCMDSLFFNCYQCEYHLDYEIIHAERLRKRMSQEKLSQGVYRSPVSISNLEHGKISPTKRKFEGLMHNLEMEKKRYNNFVVTTTYEVLGLREELNTSFSRHDINTVRENIQMLKKKIDMSYAENRRLIRTYEIYLSSITNEITTKETRDILMQLLNETYPIPFSKYYRAPLNCESMLLNMIALTYMKEGRYDETQMIYDGILSNYKRSKVNCKYHCRQYELLLANFVGSRSEMIEAVQLEASVTEGVSFALKCGKGNLLSLYFRELGYAYARDLNKEKALRIFQYSVPMAELFHNEYDVKIVKEIVQDLIGEQYVNRL